MQSAIGLGREAVHTTLLEKTFLGRPLQIYLIFFFSPEPQIPSFHRRSPNSPSRKFLESACCGRVGLLVEPPTSPSIPFAGKSKSLVALLLLLTAARTLVALSFRAIETSEDVPWGTAPSPAVCRRWSLVSSSTGYTHPRKGRSGLRPTAAHRFSR